MANSGNEVQLSHFTHIALNGEDFNDSFEEEEGDESSLCEEDRIHGGQTTTDQSDVDTRTSLPPKSQPGSGNAEVGCTSSLADVNVSLSVLGSGYTSQKNVFKYVTSSGGVTSLSNNSGGSNKSQITTPLASSYCSTTGVALPNLHGGIKPHNNNNNNTQDNLLLTNSAAHDDDGGSYFPSFTKESTSHHPGLLSTGGHSMLQLQLTTPASSATANINSISGGGLYQPSAGCDTCQKKRQMDWRGRRHASGGSNGSAEGCGDGSGDHCSSSIDGLLFEIYDRWQRDSFDSDTFTECSSTSDAFLGRVDSVHHHLEEKHGSRLSRATLLNKGLNELKETVGDLRRHVAVLSARLIRELKRRDRRLAKQHKQCDIVTAILQASSLKRRIDSKLRFSIDPLPGDDAFDQWKDAMRAVARLPQGIPPEFRKKVWLTLADKYLNSLKIDWDKTKRFAFNERTNPDDNKLGLQIVKDLHRTGCSGFSGHDNDQERALLKRVLLAYARWNKQVGYCQGFNILAAVILGVTDRREDDALKVMIFLIDAVLPSSYFDNNLRALSVDMAVFRDLLDVHNPELSKHLTHLQTSARDHITGGQYEPPLTNVFTMQWFLTLFATCLPQDTVLRVWDSVLLEGSEILLRASMAIWDRLRERIQEVSSADEFYSTMGLLTQEMLDTTLIDGDGLVKSIYQMGVFPLPQLQELREKYTYNITPFSAAISTGGGRRRGGATGIFSDDDDLEEEDLMENIGCFTGMLGSGASPTRTKPLSESDRSASHYDISKVSPGAYAANPEHLTLASAYADRINIDLYSLKQQYRKVRQRQKQAHIIITAANARHQEKRNRVKVKNPSVVIKTVAPPLQSSVAINHLFLGRDIRARLDNKQNTRTGSPQLVVATYASGGIPGGYNTATPQTERSHMASSRRNNGSHGEAGRLQKTISLQSVESEVSATSEVTKKSLSSSTSDVSTVCGDMDDVFYTAEHQMDSSDVLSSSDRLNNRENGSEEPMGKVAENSEMVAITGEMGATNYSKLNGQGAVFKDDHRVRDTCTLGNDDEINSETGEVVVKEDQSKTSNVCNATELSTENLQTSSNETVGNNMIADTNPSENVVYDSGKLRNNTVNGEVVSATTNPVTLGKVRNPSCNRPTLLAMSQHAADVTIKAGCSSNVSTCTNGTAVGNTETTELQGRSPCDPTKGTITATSSTTNANSTSRSTIATTRLHTISSSSSSTSSEDNQHTPFSNTKSSHIAPRLALATKTPKVYNPFPNQHKNTRRTQQGVKLGLYSPDYVPQLEVGMVAGRPSKVVDKSHLNMCVHRQYMEEVRQQARHMKQ